MRKGRLIYGLLLSAIAVIVFVMLFDYFRLLQAKRKLEISLTRMDKALEEMVEEKVRLEIELDKVRQEASLSQERLIKLIEEKAELGNKLGKAEETLRNLSREVLRLKDEIASLEKDKGLLKEEVSSLKQSKKLLEARTHSLKELKRMIANLKREIFQERLQRLKQRDAQMLKEGNRGYVVKDGQSTLRPKRIIRVFPADIR